MNVRVILELCASSVFSEMRERGLSKGGNLILFWELRELMEAEMCEFGWSLPFICFVLGYCLG